MIDPLNGPAMQVLIADPHLFEAGYVASLLEEHGIGIAGPFADGGEAAHAAARLDLTAAVICASPNGEVDARIADALGRRGVPYLTLIRGRSVDEPTGAGPVLAVPFAAYQVVDWVLEVSGRTSRAAALSLRD